MNKLNLIPKKLKQRFLSINDSIESIFNKLKYFKSNLKKGDIIKNNRVFFGIAAVVILTLSYFLLPTIHDKDVIQSKIKNHVSKKYNFEVKFNEKIRYGLLPKPHFVSKNLIVLKNGKEIGIIKNFANYIGLGNFFSVNDLELKDISIIDADFSITIEDLVFFEEFLKTEPNENRIIFKNSNIFFKTEDGDLLFLNKINNSKFYYDSMNLENVSVSKNNIFNIPYKLIIKNNKYRKELLINFNSKKIRLNIENITNYSEEIKEGIIELLFINKKQSLNYEITENSIKFLSEDKKDLGGYIDFKPFYLNIDLIYDGISTKNLFRNDSLLVDLIKSEILNNQNLNVNINLGIKDITNIDELNNLDLAINLEQGDITLSKSKILWKDDLEIILNDAVISYDDNEIFLFGKLLFNAKNIDDFYKSFQIKRNDRKKIKQMELDFVYNFNQNKFSFDNVRIDNKSNKKLDDFIEIYNSDENKFFNKVTFKNFVNEFFSNYDG
ncbi:hypothetical protein N9U47_00295 [Candidatus Pelagibacter sp.]|nr:hypothetical protein [Candidatus Pelagibacter sp.]